MDTCVVDDLAPMPTLGQTIRRLRRERRLSQEELAGAAALSRATIQNIENDKPKTNQGATVRALAKAFEMTLDQLEEECEAGEDLDVIEMPTASAMRFRDMALDRGMSVPDFFDMIVSFYEASPDYRAKVREAADRKKDPDPTGLTHVVGGRADQPQNGKRSSQKPKRIPAAALRESSTRKGAAETRHGQPREAQSGGQRPSRGR